MLRRLQTNSFKAVDSMNKAAVAMVKGMLVQKDLATKTVKLPTSQEGLFFVTRDNYPVGIMSMEGELSDYDPRFENIEANSQVVLEKPVAGERYATDQIVTTGLAVNDYLIAEVTVGADQGKLKKNATATSFVYGGTYTDGSKTLHIVEVR